MSSSDRPSTEPRASEIRGHGAWRRYFERAIDDDRLAHAYLFAGPEGVGKWTFARALARRLVCREPRGLDACGTCAGCAHLAAGTHADVTFVDPVAEGDRGLGVEEARERVVGAFRLRPHEAPVRVVVVNDAGRMEPAAQNALLKTLEEPPDRSLLVLVAEESGSLLETVVSRCFVLRFAPLSAEDVASVLRARGMEQEDARRLAELAEGVPGRALAWSEDRVGAMVDLARDVRSGRIGPFDAAARVADQAKSLPEKSAFERRRQAALALCAALSREIRRDLAADPDALSESAALERVALAAEEIQGHGTPELVIDRLSLALAGPGDRLPRPRP